MNCGPASTCARFIGTTRHAHPTLARSAPDRTEEVSQVEININPIQKPSVPAAGLVMPTSGLAFTGGAVFRGRGTDVCTDDATTVGTRTWSPPIC